MVEWTASFMVSGNPDTLLDAFATLMNEYEHEASLFDSMGDLILSNLILTNGKGI